MTGVTLRKARSTDAGTTGAILSAFAEQTAWMPILHTAAEAIGFCGQMIERGWVDVAEQEGKVCGFIARDGAEINALYPAPEAQGQGIGTALLQQAQRASASLNLWTFQANTGAQRFYKRHGFVEAERTDGARNEERLPDIRLIWNKDAS